MIVLASASPTRAHLLRSAGVTFEVVPARVDEVELKTRLLARGTSPELVARRLAEAKALRVSQDHGGLIIGADQTLDLDGETLSKVANLQEARRLLLRLRGRSHRLHAGAAVARDGRIRWRCVGTATLIMRAFSDSFLDAYLERCENEVVESLGCYHFEGFGAQLFARMIGDFHVVLGLPLIRLLTALRGEGALTE